MRATVLSFKNLALNLGYGIAGAAYAYFITALRGKLPSETSDPQRTAFISALQWFPWIFLTLIATLIVFAAFKLKNKNDYLKGG